MTVTIEYDLKTGLPVLPEGYFWRVGEVDARSWRATEPDMKTAVIIMKTEGVLAKTREVPVYGKLWWNKNQIVATETEHYSEIGGPVETIYETFDSKETEDEASIPEFAYKRPWNYRDDMAVSWRYDVPLTAEGVSFIAGTLFAKFQNYYEQIQAEDAVERARLEGKEKFFGDYPPKSLVK